MTVDSQNRSLIFALVFAALMSTLPLAQAGDTRQEKIRKAAAQSVKAGKVIDAIMKTPDKAIPRDLLEHAKAIAVLKGWGGYGI